MTPIISLRSENLIKAHWLTPRGYAQPCLDVDQIRDIENKAFELVDSWLLMKAAGMRSARKILDLLQHQPQGNARCVVLAGPGNNGGDAMVIASELAKKGIEIHLVDFGQKAKGSADRQKARTLCEQANIAFIKPAQMALQQASVVIDGLLGIGCTRAPLGEMAECIEAVNTARMMGHLPKGRSDMTVVSLDCPSGLNCTTGFCEGLAIKADLTLTYIALKTGLLCNHGRDHAGEILIETLGCEALLTAHTGVMTRTDQEHLHRLPQRGHQNHKGSFGSLAVIGGAHGMVGAIVLASRAAIMMGTGRVAVTLIDEQNVNPFLDHVYPEIMNKPLEVNLDFADCCVIGPGMGACASAQALLHKAFERMSQIPTVLDADALNLLADNPDLRSSLSDQRTQCSPASLVLTPHPQEAARLLGISAKQVNENRIQSAQKLAQEFHCTVVLKGSGTVIANLDSCLINCSGGPALATAGSGDVLAGVIGAFLAQGMTDFHAAATAVWLHGYCTEADGFHQEPLVVSHACEIIIRMKQLFNHLLHKRASSYS